MFRVVDITASLLFIRGSVIMRSFYSGGIRICTNPNIWFKCLDLIKFLPELTQKGAVLKYSWLRATFKIQHEWQLRFNQLISNLHWLLESYAASCQYLQWNCIKCCLDPVRFWFFDSRSQRKLLIFLISGLFNYVLLVSWLPCRIVWHL